MSLLASRLLPFFVVMALGAALARGRVLDGGHVRGLSRYVLWVGFPALLVHTLAAIARPQPRELPWLAAYGVGAATAYLIGWGLSRLPAFRSSEAAAALPLVAGAGNDAFLALPLAAAVGGPEAARLGGPMVALAWAVLVPAGTAILHRRATGDGRLRSAWRALLNPVTAGALVGVALMAAGVTPSGVIGDVLARLSASCVPVGLVAVGAVAAMPRRMDEPAPAWNPVLTASAVRLLVAPLAVGVAVAMAGGPRMYMAIAMLMAGGPTAVTAFIQAQAYERFASGAARVVALTAAGSALTLAVLASRLA